MTEVVYVNSFNKVSVFWFEPQVDMFINRPRGPRHLHLQHIGTCVKMEHHKYWDSPLIHLTFVSTLRWAAAYARIHSLVCRRWKERISMPGCRSFVRGNYSRRSSISSPVINWITTCGHILYSSSHFNRTLTLNKYASSSTHHEKRIRCICPSNPSKTYDEGEWAILNCNSETNE